MVYVDNAELAEAVSGVDMAEIAITSGWQAGKGQAPAGAFTLADVPGVAVVVEKAEEPRLEEMRAVMALYGGCRRRQGVS